MLLYLLSGVQPAQNMAVLRPVILGAYLELLYAVKPVEKKKLKKKRQPDTCMLGIAPEQIDSWVKYGYVCQGDNDVISES